MLGPVFYADLRSHSRRPRMLLLRMGFLGILLCMFILCYAGLPVSASKKQATVLADFASQFVFLYMIGQFVFLMLIGPTYVASAIAEEKQRGTLDYLFSSNLSNYEIIVGKYFSRLFLLLQYVLIGLPVLALTQLIGGVSLELIVGMLLGTLGCLASLTALSLLLSVISRQGRDALVRTFMVLISLLGSWYLLFELRHSTLLDSLIGPLNAAEARVAINHVLNLNPVYIALLLREHLRVFGNIEGLPLRWFGLCCGLHLIMAAGFVAASILIVRKRFHKINDLTVKRDQLVHAYTKPAVWAVYPLYWKERYVHSKAWKVFGWQRWLQRTIAPSVSLLVIKPVFVLVVLSLFFGYLILFPELLQSSQWLLPLTSWIVFGLILCSMLAALVRTASGIAIEKDRETWDTLIASPVTTNDLLLCRLYGGFLSARWLFLFSVIIMVAVCTRPLSIQMGYYSPPSSRVTASFVFAITNVGYLIFTLGLAGYYSLSSSSSIRNVMSALTVMLVLNLFPLGVLFFYRGGSTTSVLVNVIYVVTDPASIIVIICLGCFALLCVVLYYRMPQLRWLYGIVKWLGNLLLLNALLLLVLSSFTFAFGEFFPFHRVVMFGAPHMLDFTMLSEFIFPLYHRYYGDERGALLFLFSSGVVFGSVGVLLFLWSVRKLRRTCGRVEYSSLAAKQRRLDRSHYAPQDAAD